MWFKAGEQGQPIFLSLEKAAMARRHDMAIAIGRTGEAK